MKWIEWSVATGINLLRESMKFKNYDLEMMPITARSWPKKFFWQITKYIQYYIFYIILYIQGKDLKNFVQV